MTQPAMQQRFADFHAANPHVYDILVDLARTWVANTNGKRIGLRALFERARWEIRFRTTTSPDLKLNNNLAPYYARLLMDENEDLAGLFEIRKSAADGRVAA